MPDTFGYRVSYGGDTVTTDDPAMPDELRGLSREARRARRALRAGSGRAQGTTTGAIVTGSWTV